VNIDPKSLSKCVDGLLATAAIGGDWKTTLDKFSSAVGSRAAALTRSTDNSLSLVGSEVLNWAFADLNAGKTPPYSADVLAYSRSGTFYLDTEPGLQERLHRLPFYREYMCVTVDIPWRTSALICGPNDDTGTRLSFWRSSRQGPFSPSEIDCLQTILPSVRIAAVFSERFAEGRALGKILSYRERGDAVLRFDFAGRLVDDDTSDIDRRFFANIRGKLVTKLHAEQAALDRAIGAAASPEACPGAVALSGANGSRAVLLLVPVCGDARDIFATTAALGVVVDRRRAARPHPELIVTLRAAFGLTPREAEVCHLTSLGMSPAGIAQATGISLGTVRTHLKNAMQKAEVHSQVELAALVFRLH
jgi:DNA-binding CsgD family transcriptional regulator